MADMIFGGKNIRDVICKGPENIGFISGGSGIKELSNLSKDQISGIINMMYGLDSLADIIIIDTWAGISDAVIDIVLASSEVLFQDDTGTYIHNRCVCVIENNKTKLPDSTLKIQPK